MTPDRAGYLRLLMTLALVAQVTYITYGWAWLSFLVAPGLLLAGVAALIASAVQRREAAGRPNPAGPAVRTALVRLLLPFWLFAAGAVTVMLRLGWEWSADVGSSPLDAGTAWLWLLPLADPPVSTPGLPWTEMLWFVRALLWFVLLTPALLWTARRWPLRLAVVPVVVVLLVSLGLVNVYGRVHDLLVTFCVYACCWLLGFAYADGRLLRLGLLSALALGTAAVGLGLWCWWGLAEQYGAEDLTDVPPATLLVSAGAVLLVLRAQPAFRWLGRLRRTGTVLRFFSNRMVTTLLWAGPASLTAPFVLDEIGVYAAVDERWHALLNLAAIWVLLLDAVVLLGWAERPLLRRRRPVAPQPRRYVLEGNVVAGNVVVDR